MSSEDDTILEAARRTGDILGLSGFSLTAVLWQEVDFPGRRGAKVITPHFPVLVGSKLVISEILRGRLAAEDWGPILAPSLIFCRKLKRRSTVGTFLRILPALLILTGFLVLPEALASPVPLIVGLIVAAVVFFVLGVYSAIRLDRLLVLEADKEAAKVIGSVSLIEALRKFEHLRELDAARGGEWPEYGDHPSITKRIASLQNP
ncbi:hypothetical protein E6H31_03120 [Candidatus Bathyarchaeota archaeon]|nr:MAG: hypothetical protein E6H31_03120 [Candidatus Bathyarchaeota archaeon]